MSSLPPCTAAYTTATHQPMWASASALVPTYLRSTNLSSRTLPTLRS